MANDPTPDTQSALLSFTAENARSYRDEVHLSLLAGRLSPKSVVRTLPTAGQPVRVLPAAGLFGANASGKSTLLKAMADMRTRVLSSFPQLPGTGITRHDFLLEPDESRVLRPTRFEIELVLGGVRWQYCSELDDSYVLGEHAHYYPNGRQALVFRRERSPEGDDDVVFGPAFRAQGQRLHRFVPANALLLSVAGAVGFEPLTALFAWFHDNFHTADSTNRAARTHRTIEFLEDPQAQRRARALLRAADLAVTDAARTPIDPGIREILRRIDRESDGEYDIDAVDEIDSDLYGGIQLTHRTPHGSVVLVDSHESLGTLVWVGLIGSVLDALDRGTVLLVDELDASLHPHLVRDLVELFQSPRRNPNSAQLVFNAHDVTLLGDSSERTLSRDQVWFTEKQSNGATILYPLSDFRPRHDEAVERRYRQGRYGGVPTINPAEYVRATEPIDR